mgnify:CR=1 FL=1
MTDRQKDVQTALGIVGQDAAYIQHVWNEFETGWDGAWCSETACCISYLAGNLDKILVSNYAEGLVAKYKAVRRFGRTPEVGAFVFFGYDGVPDHTGRVVDVKGQYITTVEGNVNGRVVKRYWYQNAAYIYGYGYPAYTDEEENDMTKTEEYILEAVEDTVIKRGMKEPEHLIKMVQAYLQFYGYYDGTIDGDFGLYSENAVKEWQRHDGREITGEIRKADWEQIRRG